MTSPPTTSRRPSTSDTQDSTILGLPSSNIASVSSSISSNFSGETELSVETRLELWIPNRKERVTEPDEKSFSSLLGAARTKGRSSRRQSVMRLFPFQAASRPRAALRGTLPYHEPRLLDLLGRSQRCSQVRHSSYHTPPRSVLNVDNSLIYDQRRTGITCEDPLPLQYKFLAIYTTQPERALIPFARRYPVRLEPRKPLIESTWPCRGVREARIRLLPPPAQVHL